MAVIGRNGAGKTTLLRIVAGFLTPGGGELRFRQGERPPVGWLGEGEPLPPSLTLRQVAAIVCPEQRERRRVHEGIERLGLSSVADTPVGALSWGQRRRAGLAVALTAPGELTLLDEPLLGVDPLEQERCLAAIQWTAASGRAVLLATHLVAEVEPVVHDVAVLDHGRVVLRGGVAALIGELGVQTLRELVLETLSL